MDRVKGFSFLCVCYLLVRRDGKGQGFSFLLSVEGGS